LFERHGQALAAWPETLPDEPVRFEAEIDGVAWRLDDWLGDLRRDAVGARARVLLVSTGLLKDNKYRRDKLLQWWVPHLAGHLGGHALTTVLVSKAGSVTLPPLPHETALAHWHALLAAWCAGLRRPLPVAVATGFAWLAKGGSADAPPAEPALAAVRSAYEGKDGENGERQRNAYLARAYPDFDALLADGDFARLADALLRPLAQSLGDRARGDQA